MALVVGTLAVGCGASDLVLPPDGRPTSIEVVTGDNQTGQAGDLLEDPVIVVVTDARGQPVEGASIVFELTDAGDGAEILPPAAATDSGGRAEARMLLGMEAGPQTGEARVMFEAATAATVAFTALVVPGTPNRAPTADYDWHCESLTCQFTDASRDDDGSLTSWEWRFGDGGSSPEREPAHTYGAPGTYTVTLAVTDNDGATDSHEAHVIVQPVPQSPNKAPDADFDVNCAGLTCTFIDKSKDDDGFIASWRWDFGDGSPVSTEQYPIHAYSSSGKHPVVLIVTDDAGASDIKTHDADPKN